MAQNDIIVPREGAGGVLTEIVLPDATTTARGLLSSADKTKLDSAAWALEIRGGITLSADETLTTGRNVQQQVSSFSATTFNVTLPISDVQAGDTFTIIGVANSTGGIVIRRQNWSGDGFGPQFTILATAVGSGGAQRFSFRAATTASSSWALLPVDTHTQPASTITGLPTASTATPSALGVAAAGTSADFSRADHVHAMPSAADVGAAAATHAAFHATGGSDPLAPSDIGAQSLFVGQNLDINASVITLTAARAKTFYLTNFFGASEIRLPETGATEGDLFKFVWGTGSPAVPIKQSVSPFATLATIGSSSSPLSFIRNLGTWSLVAVDFHEHGAGQITSGSFGNISFDGKLGSTAGLPVVTTTAGAVTTLALGTAGQVLTVNSGATGVEFAAASGGGVTGAASSASDVLGVSGANITGVDATADRIVFWDDSANKLTYAATTGGTFDGTTLRWPVELVIACSDETTNLTTGTAKVTFRAPYAFTLTGVRASVNTAPTGSTLIADINEGGTSVLSTKLSIDASEKTSTTAASAAVISDSAIADDAEITIDIDQIGSTIAGKGLKVVLIGTRV